MKVFTAIAATALLLSVTAASAQTSPNAGRPDAAMNAEKGSPASKSKPHQARRSGMSSPQRSTTGSGSETTGSGSARDIPGVTQGSNPNPSWNRNPDPEVPGNTEE